MESIDYMMINVKSQDGELLTREEEVALSKDIEAGIIAECILQKKNPYGVKPNNTTFNDESLIADIMKRVGNDEDSPLAEVMGFRPLDDFDERDENQRHEYHMVLRKLNRFIRNGRRSDEVMITRNMRLVVSIAKRYRNSGVDFTDMVQEGNIGLIHAVHKFDWRHGYKFSSYAVHWIPQYIERMIKNSARTIRVPVHMEDKIRKVNNAIHDMGEDADVNIIAHMLKYSVKQVNEIMRYDRNTRILSMDMKSDKDDDGSASIMDYIGFERDAFDMVASSEEMTNIKNIINDDMSDVERVVIMMVNGIGMEKMSIRSVSDKMGISRTTVSKINNRAKEILREKLSL